jgi:hypothetical protein
MNVEIGSQQSLFWKYLFRIYGIVSLHCTPSTAFEQTLLHSKADVYFLILLKEWSTRSSSDDVQIVDDKTVYIPNFFLFVGNEKGYKFKVIYLFYAFLCIFVYVVYFMTWNLRLDTDRLTTT